MSYLNEMELRQHIYSYVPKIWRENIGRVAFVPYYTNKDIQDFKAHTFPEQMPWYIREAIEDFLNKEGV